MVATIPQVHAVWWRRSRKENLVTYGFDYLPPRIIGSKFEEFEELQNQVIYVSATPADYESNFVKAFL